jgi:hypothetical protein
LIGAQTHGRVLRYGVDDFSVVAAGRDVDVEVSASVTGVVDPAPPRQPHGAGGTMREQPDATDRPVASLEYFCSPRRPRPTLPAGGAQQTFALARRERRGQSTPPAPKKPLAMFSNKQFIKHRAGWAMIQPSVRKRQSTPRRQRESWRADGRELR